MKKFSKKEIRKVVANLIESALSEVNLRVPSDKTKKALVKLSRKLSTLLDDEIKKQKKLQKKALKKINENYLIY